MVYVILADGFEEIEALTPVDVLRRGGIEVKTVGISGKSALGAHGIRVECDIEASDELSFDGVDMLVFPGGMPGASNIDAYPATDEYIKKTLDNGGYIGAICAAPMVLGRRKYLAGREAVCFPGFEQYLKGAAIVDADTVKDGPFVTSRCMGCAMSFALKLAECLLGEEKAKPLDASVNAREL